jgi:hypothetical protein
LYNTKDARYCRKPKVSNKELTDARDVEVEEKADVGESEEDEEVDSWNDEEFDQNDD